MSEQRESGIPFGSYRLVKRLARGGMAEVFLARQRGPEGFERRVAVKRILPHLVDAEDFVQMFLDEARLAAQLSHPHIVHIYEFGKVEEYYFIAMEYVDGVDAAVIVEAAAQTPVPPEIVARIGADAAAGLHHAHELAGADGKPLGIVHRDVSPQNVRLSYDGTVKIVDFGIGKAAHHVERTRPGVVKGKYAYMSPEQVVGKSLDDRSDVFSLGLVLWELLAGRFAVSRDDAPVAMRRIRDGDIPPIETVRPDTPPELAAVLRRALTKRREDRPTAARFGLALEGYLKSCSNLATPMVVAEWVRARFPRDPSDASAAPEPPSTSPVEPAAAPVADGVLAASGPPVVMDERDTQVTPTPPMEEQAQRDTGRWRTRLLGAVGVLAVAAGIALMLVAREPGPAAVAAPRRVQTSTAANLPDGPLEPTPPASVLAAPVAPEPVVAAPPSSSIEIITDPPGASVSFDGEDLGRVTPTRIAEVPAGEHVVRMERDGYRPLERVVTIGNDERRTLDVALASNATGEPSGRPGPRTGRREPVPAAAGYLTVKTIPWSDVFLGTRRLGATPLAEIELPAGVHRLTFKNPDVGQVERFVTIRPGQTTKLSVQMDDRTQLPTD